MKICFFADIIHPNAKNWIEYFAETFEHEIHAISFSEPKNYSKKVIVHKLPDNKYGKFRYLFGNTYLKNTLKDITPDLLIGFRLTSYAYMTAKTGFKPLVSVAQSQKATGLFPFYLKPLMWYTARKAVKSADICLAWAPHMADDMVSLGARIENIVTIPRGVNQDIFIFKPKERQDDFVLISTRGLYNDYCIDLVIQAVAGLKNQISKLKYIIVGDGPDRKRLELLVTDLNVNENIKFVGKIPYNNIPRYIEKADLYLSPVPMDGVSSSLLEAFSSGIYPLVTDIYANQYWGELGCSFNTFKPFDKNDLERKILDSYKHRSDFDKILKTNKAIVEEHASWKTNMKKLESIFSDLANTKQPKI